MWQKRLNQFLSMYLFYDCLSLRCSRQADGSLYTLITLVLVVGRPQTELKNRPPSPTAASHALSVALSLRSADSLNTCAAALPHWSCHHFKMIFCLKRPRAEGPQCNTSVRMTVLLLQQCRLGFEMRERERGVCGYIWVGDMKTWLQEENIITKKSFFLS